MVKYSISVDLAEIANVAKSAVNAQVFPLLNQAVRAVAQATQSNWMEAVQRAKLWSGEKDAYSASITYKMTGDFSAVVETNYQYATDIETGRPPRDLKKMLDTSLKVRQSKQGRRYMIIPFRHNTPGNDAHAPAMPQSVYDMASQMAPSRVVGQTNRVSGTGAYSTKTKKILTVPQSVYKWGDRLPAGMAPKMQTRHKTDPYAGMVRFDAKSPKTGQYSTYMTFRVMAEGSSGWIVPAKPGQYIAKTVSDNMRPLAEEAFQEAIRRTR